VPVTAPTAPRDLVANADSQGNVTLTWAAPVDSGGSPVFGYRIERCNANQATCLPATATTTTCPSSSAFCTLVSNNGGLLSATFSAISGQTTYTFAVTALTAVNVNTAVATARPVSGSLVTAVLATPSSSTTPTAPTNFTVTPGNTQNVLGWAAPVSAGATAVASYRIERSLSGANSWTQIGGTIAAATLTFTDTGLVNGTLYDYRIAAVNSTTGTPNYATASGRPFTAASVPQSVVATAGEGSVMVTW
jgi:titin